MKYAKLIGGELVFAPHRLFSGEYVIYNPPAALLRGKGYKPLIYTDAPAAEEGFAAVSGWTETEEAIVQTWSVEPDKEISDEEALDILLGGESA